MSTAEATTEPGGTPSAPPKTHYQSQSMFWVGVLIVVGIFATTLPQPAAMGNLPLKFILIKQLNCTPTVASGFFTICGFFWYLKPLAGILTDAVPLFGTRRRNYLLLSALLAGVCWVGMIFVPHTYTGLLAGAITVNLFMVMASTVVGAFLVELGQSLGATGRLTAVRQVTFYACSLITSPLGGRIATGSLLLLGTISAAGVVSVIPFAFLLMREKPVTQSPGESLANSKLQLSTIFKNRPFWFAIAFIALFYFAPGFNTLQNFRQLKELHLTTVQVGNLGFTNAAGSVIATLTYALIVRRLALKILLAFGVATTAISVFFYIFYNSYALGSAIDFQYGFFFGFCEVALIDLAARATPAGCEGIGYSCILSMRNLSGNLSDTFGAYLHDAFRFGWSTMVTLNGATTAIVLILLPFMPKMLMGSRDGSKPNTENTGEPQAA